MFARSQTLVICNRDNEMLDTLVVEPNVGDAEFKFRIPEGLGEIRVFGVGVRVTKILDQWEDVQETFAQYYTVARADDKVSQEVTAYLKDGELTGLGTSINAICDSRPMDQTESLRNRIHADARRKTKNLT